MSMEQLVNTVAQLDRALAEAPHEDDAGAPNEQQRRWERRQQLSKLSNLCKTRGAAVREAEAQLRKLEPWQADVSVMRQTLADELMACDPRSPKRYGLELSIRQIDRGLPFNTEMLPARLPLDDLLLAAGYQTGGTLVETCGAGWLGCLPDVEKKCAALRRQRDAAQHALTTALRAADTLLDHATV